MIDTSDARRRARNRKAAKTRMMAKSQAVAYLAKKGASRRTPQAHFRGTRQFGDKGDQGTWPVCDTCKCKAVGPYREARLGRNPQTGEPVKSGQDGREIPCGEGVRRRCSGSHEKVVCLVFITLSGG